MINVLYVKQRRSQLGMLSCYAIMLGRASFACSGTFIHIFGTHRRYWIGGKIYMSLPDPPLDDLSKMWVLYTWWSIWKARNDFLHKDKSLDPFRIIEVVNRMLQDHITHGMNHSLRKTRFVLKSLKFYLAKKTL